MKPWFKNVTPHQDIKLGILDEAVFAANLGEVAHNEGKEVYNNPELFFSKTSFTKGLKNISKKVLSGLNGGVDAENRVISLQTGFGGGKTHALICLYHLASWGKKANDSPYTKELISFSGKFNFDKANIAVFTNTTNDPAQGRKTEALHIRTLWGEIAYQLGGIEGYEMIRKNDEDRVAPKGLFKKILQKYSPALILIDELADYSVSASAVKYADTTLADQTLSFIQEISEAVSLVDKCVMVATLPASVVEVGNSEKAAAILTSLSNRLTRVGKDTKPVEDEEIYEVIRRRLFENIGDDEEINKVISGYIGLYSGCWSELPSHVSKAEYKKRMLSSYPFHPELIDMFRIRWASHHDFQRTRGVLRLLASIVADLWNRQNSLSGDNSMIHTSDVNFANLDPLTSQLKKLYGNGYDAVIAADVSGSSANAFKIDQESKEYGAYNLTQGIASSILMGSFGSSGINKGLSLDEIKLSVLKPDSFNHNSINGALYKLEETAHYLYYSSSGHKRYWFHTKPNIKILIDQAKKEIEGNKPDVHSEILKRINNRKAAISSFNMLVDPGNDIPEQVRPTLVVLHPKFLANPAEVNGNTKTVIEKLATKKGAAERIYRNTMLFMVCSEVAYPKLHSFASEYLACLRVIIDYQGQLEKEQKEEIKKRSDELSNNMDNSLSAAYSIILKYSVKNGLDKLIVTQFKDSFDAQVSQNILSLLKSEEWLLDAVGLNELRKNNLLPTLDNPVRAKDIYEAFLRYDDKPMVTGLTAIQRSIEKYCFNGEYAIATGDGKEFSKIFIKENIPFFDIKDETYWLVDKSLYRPKEEQTNPNIEETGPKTETGEKENKDKKPDDKPKTEEIKVFKSITISGKVDVANYNQLFSSFIMPLAQNNIEIEIRIKGKTTHSKPLTENSTEYKITKESAKQLGLNFEEE